MPTTACSTPTTSNPPAVEIKTRENPVPARHIALAATLFAGALAIPLLTPSLAPAQTPTQTVAVSRENRTVSVTATEQVTVLADAATVHVGYLTYGKDRDTAYSTATTLSSAIIKALTGSGIALDAIESDSQGIEPVQNFQGQNPVEHLSPEAANRRFQVQQSWLVHVPAADAAKALDVAVRAGASQSGQIDWSLRDENAATSDATSRAVKRAQTVAAQLLSPVGGKVGALLFASTDNESATIRPMAMQAMQKTRTASQPPHHHPPPHRALRHRPRHLRRRVTPPSRPAPAITHKAGPLPKADRTQPLQWSRHAATTARARSLPREVQALALVASPRRKRRPAISHQPLAISRSHPWPLTATTSSSPSPSSSQRPCPPSSPPPTPSPTTQKSAPTQPASLPSPSTGSPSSPCSGSSPASPPSAPPPDNTLVLPGTPGHLLTLEQTAGHIIVRTADPSVLLAGKPVPTGTVLPTNEEDTNALASGTIRLWAINRNGKPLLRVKDSNAPRPPSLPRPALVRPDPRLRITARWIPYTTPHTLTTHNQIGQATTQTVPGYVEFTLNNSRQTLIPLSSGKDGLWFVFRDATYLRNTDGGGRFLTTDPPPTASTSRHRHPRLQPGPITRPAPTPPTPPCPLASPENRLPTPIPAGEKRYQD